MNACNALIGSDSNILAKASPVTPATSAKSCKESPPSDTAVAISEKNLLIDDPPRSAVIPSDDIAADSPSICDSLTPSELSVPTNIVARFIISVSVVAYEFPKCTNADARLSIVVTPVPVIFVNLANASEASLADKDVAVPTFAIVSVNPSKSSCATPNCPAIDANSANSP